LWTALSAHPDVARSLVELFHALHQPDFAGDRDAKAAEIEAAILANLETISSADEDLIIRHFLNLILVTLRTNFFQRDKNGARRPALAIKFDSQKVDGLPEPKPYREISVYAPDVEGIHLRGGEIARGGLRWSDRPEDFRTEILGLVKAQMVKNAVIVPVGAKGGFVPKTMPAHPDRETFMSIGTNAYKTFIGALLDITDNLDGDQIIPPQETVRRDGDDPYLVVAADKGTASFSDTANAIAQSRDFWLDDAFASGGSVGYDHKKMGITARGGWEAVKRHFREMDRDTQSEPFTVVGIGDMSGDVFGNGMLLSEHIQLQAAFDHRDIFIDPTPDTATSFAERKRLFELPRSSWQDYNQELLSAGGGIYPRSLKTIDLSPQARKMLDLGDEALTPQMVMIAILKARADLLWFGGIGSYIRASSETNADAGDRANDAIRITGKQVRAKVIGEGANLGTTHLARIEYANNGGRINTDAIDNSAGVNSSDLEVNIKIALGTLTRSGKIKTEERNSFLASMTDEVAHLCLRNNYLQTLSISLTQRQGTTALPDLVTLVQELEEQGHLNRAVEYIPDDATLIEWGATDQTFTRPELAVLLAYAKNTLYADLLNSSVPDDPYLAKELFRYFPERLKAKYPATIENHRLRREVIATVLANAIVNRGGTSFVHRMTSITSASPAEVARAYAAARDAYGLQDLNAQIDALDCQMEGETQLALYAEVQTLLVEQTLWFLRNVNFTDGLAGTITTYQKGIADIQANLGALLPPFVAKSVADQAVGFAKGGAPVDLARRISELSALTLASDIVLAANKSKASTKEAAEAYFKVLETFSLGRITEQGSRIHLSDRFDRMALDRALANLMHAQTGLTCDVLAASKGPIKERYEAWHQAHAGEIDRTIATVTALTDDELTVSRLSVAAGLLADLVGD
jgi:glutamate dehydrogenase